MDCISDFCITLMEKSIGESLAPLYGCPIPGAAAPFMNVVPELGKLR
jgi:hypothetical protein